MNTTLEYLLNVQAPAKTSTYSPLLHGELVESIKEHLDKLNLVIKDEKYVAARSGMQMFGTMTLAVTNGEQDMQIGFRNSYDKSMQVGIVTGSRVIVCSNMMFRGDFRAMQMHSGEVLPAVKKLVVDGVDSLEKNYLIIQDDSEKLKSVRVDEKQIAHILGELFYTQSIITTTQLGIIRKELDLKENFSDETLWDIYNHTTEALKKSAVSDIISDHIKVHEYYLELV